MTKSEQTVYDRIKAANDAGHLCRDPVGRTKGTYSGRLRGYSDRKPIKAETTALARLVAVGMVYESHYGAGYVINNHPVLQTIAASIDLLRQARRVEQKRVEHENELADFNQWQAFVREHSK